MSDIKFTVADLYDKHGYFSIREGENFQYAKVTSRGNNKANSKEEALQIAQDIIHALNSRQELLGAAKAAMMMIKNISGKIIGARIDDISKDKFKSAAPALYEVFSNIETAIAKAERK